MARQWLALLLSAAVVLSQGCAAEQVTVGTRIAPEAQKTVAARVFEKMDVAQGQDLESVLERFSEVLDDANDSWLVVQSSDVIVDENGYHQVWYIFNDGSALRFFGANGETTGTVEFIGVEVTADALGEAVKAKEP